MRPIALAGLLLAACSGSSPAMSGDPQTLCTKMLTKQLVCSGGDDSCTISLDGGSSCADMAGTTVAPDPTDVANCTAGAPYWNVAYYNSFFACYLDGKTTMCDDDFKNCQGAAVTKVGRRSSDVAFGSACQSSTCSFEGELCDESVFFSDAVVQAATQCFNQACATLSDCLAAAHFG